MRIELIRRRAENAIEENQLDGTLAVDARRYKRTLDRLVIIINPEAAFATAFASKAD